MSTVYEIDPAGYAAGRSLFEAATVTFDRAYWIAPFEGDCPARLFVDDPADPKSALLARTYDYFLAGEASPDLIAFMNDAPVAANPLEWFYGYVPLTPAWRETLPAAMPDLFREDRRSFRLGVLGESDASTWRTRIPAGIEVRVLDPLLARQADTDVPEEIELLIGSYDRFAGSCFGYAAIDSHSGRVLGVAYTAGVCQQEVNLGVGTAEVARRRGLAKLLCQACCDRAAALGVEVTWDCDRVNTASGALAESLGFVEEAAFVELAFPDPEKGMPHRRIPAPSGVEWRATPQPNGVTRWTRDS
ncbi:MAG: GNAT family N-acetyltransferase [Thermomicrobiales bacterium]|nr:GNAT family N-acetyltransferase [Thermomicrobiales bacterium]